MGVDDNPHLLVTLSVIMHSMKMIVRTVVIYTHHPVVKFMPVRQCQGNMPHGTTQIDFHYRMKPESGIRGTGVTVMRYSHHIHAKASLIYTLQTICKNQLQHSAHLVQHIAWNVSRNP